MDRAMELKFLNAGTRSGKGRPPCSGVLLALILILLPSLAPADIFRCVSDDGVVRYSDNPCGDDAVPAFDEYKPSVDDAAGRDIIKPLSDRSRLDDIEQDLKAHAIQLGIAIVPNQKLNHVFKDKAGDPGRNEVLDWLFTLFFGPEAYDRQWRIEIFYRGRMEGAAVVWLRTIRIQMDGAPMDPSTMQGLKAFRKIKSGEWAYQRQDNGEQVN
jgi:hypothetical protein